MARRRAEPRVHRGDGVVGVARDVHKPQRQADPRAHFFKQPGVFFRNHLAQPAAALVADDPQFRIAPLPLAGNGVGVTAAADAAVFAPLPVAFKDGGEQFLARGAFPQVAKIAQFIADDGLRVRAQNGADDAVPAVRVADEQAVFLKIGEGRGGQRRAARRRVAEPRSRHEEARDEASNKGHPARDFPENARQPVAHFAQALFDFVIGRAGHGGFRRLPDAVQALCATG